MVNEPFHKIDKAGPKHKTYDTVLLARLIYSESRGEPEIGQIAVGQVVFNRMKRDNATMKEVIFRAGQFDGIHTHQFKTYDEQCFRSAVMVIKGAKVIEDDVYYYHNPRTATDKAHINNLITRYVIGRHDFASNRTRYSSRLQSPHAIPLRPTKRCR